MEQLFIPTRIQKDNIFGKGFGRKELKRIVISTLCGTGIGLLLGLLFFSSDTQSILMTTVIVGMLTCGCAYFILVKNSINMSVFDYIQLVKAFFQTQQYFRYRKLKEWY